MGNVISLKKAKKKKEENFNQSTKKTQTVTEKSTTECPIVLKPQKNGSRTDVDYAELESEQQIEYWKNLEKEEEEKFKTKYNDVLAVVPVTAGAKMQYFATVMLRLLPDIFHEGWDTRFDIWMDFCQFYITGFDSAYSDYIKANKEFEQPYEYKFKEMAAEKLEEELKGCLEKLVALYPEKTDADKTAMMYHAARLFELQDLLSDLFCMEVMKD